MPGVQVVQNSDGKCSLVCKDTKRVLCSGMSLQKANLECGIRNRVATRAAQKEALKNGDKK